MYVKTVIPSKTLIMSMSRAMTEIRNSEIANRE